MSLGMKLIAHEIRDSHLLFHPLPYHSTTYYTLSMPRYARLVVPALAHHITQRGNNRQDVFFVDDDRAASIYHLSSSFTSSSVRMSLGMKLIAQATVIPSIVSRKR